MLPVVNAWSQVTAGEIDALRVAGDVRALADLLGNRHPDVQWRAAEALGSLGPAATKAVLRCLGDPKTTVRLGALDALAGIRDASCTDAVIDTLAQDPNAEVRWAAAIALGQIGDPRGIPSLVKNLANPDKFIRFGAARSLKDLGWDPGTPEERAALCFAFQEWADLRAIGRPAVPLLIHALSDHDRDVRRHAVSLLGEMRAPEVRSACDRALGDADSAVRWNAVLASKKCGVPMIDLPMFVSRRPKIRPNPYAAAILNFFFLGLGYNYLGKWWGFLIFMSYMTIMLLISIEVSSNLPLFTTYPNLYSYPVTGVFAYHAFRMAQRVPDL